MVEGVDTDEDAGSELVACDALVREVVEDAADDDDGVTLLDGVIDTPFVDDGSTLLDECTREEEAALLDVICMFEWVIDTTPLLEVAVAVQTTCGTTLSIEGTM